MNKEIQDLLDEYDPIGDTKIEKLVRLINIWRTEGHIAISESYREPELDLILSSIIDVSLSFQLGKVPTENECLRQIEIICDDFSGMPNARNLAIAKYFHSFLSSPSSTVLPTIKEDKIETGWISVEERLPLCYQTGNFDGKKSNYVLAEDIKGIPYVAVLYSGIIDGVEFNDFYTSDDFSLKDVIKWKPIN